MRAFYKIKRDGTGLWVKMYTDCKFPWHAACLPLHLGNDVRQQAKEAFKEFVAELRRDCID